MLRARYQRLFARRQQSDGVLDRRLTHNNGNLRDSIKEVVQACEQRKSQGPAKASRCHYCSGLTIRTLIEPAKKEFSDRERALSFPEVGYYPHHQSFDDLENSARQGCDFCDLILKSSRTLPGPDISGTYPDVWHCWERLDSAAIKYDSIYSAAEARNADVRIALACSFEYMYSKTAMEEVAILDTLHVQFGDRIGSEDQLGHFLGGSLNFELCITVERGKVPLTALASV